MIKSALLPPYTFKPYEMRRTATFPKRNVPGVYMIYKDNILRYVGYSGTNLYRTLYRHFQDWSSSNQKRTVYKNLANIKVRVIYCSSSKAEALEKALIIKLKPKDNPHKYEKYTTDKREQHAYDLYTGARIKNIIVRTDEIDPF